MVPGRPQPVATRHTSGRIPVPTQRERVDYALERRALLRRVHLGKVSPDEVCDATPYLLRAAEWNGQRSGRDCPLCKRAEILLVPYVYGDELGSGSGQTANVGELCLMAQDYAEIKVYVVEVCPRCEWNHLVETFVLGHAQEKVKPRRRSV
jgi:hypothetical protein